MQHFAKSCVFLAGGQIVARRCEPLYSPHRGGDVHKPKETKGPSPGLRFGLYSSLLCVVSQGDVQQQQLPAVSQRSLLKPAEETGSWDNYKGSPMLELWTASTRNLVEPQVPD